MKKTTLALGLALCAPAVWAADLAQSLQAAQKYDATIAAARNTLLAGREKAEQGRALLLPKLSVDGSYAGVGTDYHPGNESPSSPAYDKNGAQYGATLNATQPLYRADLSASKDQLLKQSDLAELQYSAAEQDLILRVARAYFDVLEAEAKVELAVAQKQAVALQLEQARKMFEVGTATITDTNEAQAQYDAIVANEIQYNNDLAVRRAAYTELTSLDAQGLLPANPDLPTQPPQPNVLDEWLQTAQERNTSLLAQKLNLDIAKREIDKYRLASSPTLDLVASYGAQWRNSGISSSGGNDRTNSGSIGLQLSIPLFTGGARSSQLREAVAKDDAQRDTVEATRRGVVQQTRQAFLGVQSGAAQVNALRQSLKSSQSTLESTKLGREVGVRTTVDVLNAQQSYFLTRYNLISARYEYLYSRLQLAAAVGTLGENDLAQINGWLKSGSANK
ncbi:outer membrane protein [Andreprevotia lacus DSM 23236]|jgi:outer membrane protein|uniref:Outer membrane protein n=1 Tax=Andreprevotia lacus DSM 23236 TaxID=1121001 RepID=A0A1W1Y0M9_9NEIS|nr:TolC family outer membrane protein [Andreprevotia lacus]SMC29716.1 outer membrane protein [Andreprevotia lacus DSM 23236]